MRDIRLKHSVPSKPRLDSKRNRIWARAPYNFVPLPEQVVLAQAPLTHDAYHPEGLTGWIECELETCAPTYIRGMMTELLFEQQGEKKPDALSEEEKLARAPFFSTGEGEIAGFPAPVIPGSSLRGMIRALVEIAGYGRMRWVGREPTFTFRAVAASRDDPLPQPYEDIMGRYGSNVRAGYLVRMGEEWVIHPARRPQDLGFSERNPYLKVKERQIQATAITGYVRLNSPRYRPAYYPVSFEGEAHQSKRGSFTAITRIGDPKTGYRYRGVLVCSGNMLETNASGDSPRKSHTLVLEPDPRARPLPINKQVIEDYLAGLTPYQKESLWAGAQGCLKEGAPVFYVTDGKDIVAFGHSPNFRAPARIAGADHASNPQDFVPDDLTNAAQPDLADAIFGWVEENGAGLKEQRAGRVFFQDAHFVKAEGQVWYKPQPVTPHTLAAPKPTTFQHYLVQDAQQGHDPDDKAQLAHYGTPPDQTQIRGHKLYWHKGNQPDIEATATELQHKTQLTRIMPLAVGAQFKFRVRFENLRPEELGALLWALSLPGEADKTYRHKLGMGKPLGMGAVAITPQLVLTSRLTRYTSLFTQDASWEQASESAAPQPYVNAFETFVLKQLGVAAGRLTDVERIRMLLTMLEWRESDPNWLEATRYMEIEHGLDKVNEYKERPVLPDPLAVVAGQPVRSPVPAREEGAKTRLPQQQRTSSTPPPVAADVKTGRVKEWKEDRGFGFITQEDGSEIFVHHSGIRGEGRKSLQEGQRVQYTVEKDMKGRPQAQDVHPI
ncbi:MAG: TIGR03986 family CRISPR-associated RAMP protein [Anaerolineae bacterium]|jgi:CRISPR-associated protein (TIGR03986 family)|nr:TIGR03986 family CRISPR-associated RAMP protein [Anaerolineae bacterium]